MCFLIPNYREPSPMIVYKGKHVEGKRDSFAPFGIALNFQCREDMEDFLARMLVAPSHVNNSSRVANCHDTCANGNNADALYNFVKQCAQEAIEALPAQ